jgi:NAD(P)-dependent dehydrogenase (short-subunit alcohol dehydrogenase family)
VKTFKDRVAVVTGGASGIGRAMANRFAAEGMQVVIADVERPALNKAESELRAAGTKVLAVQTDVSKAKDIEALAVRTIDAFGAVHVLCNNAGVATAGPLWEHSLKDWEWVFGVNLWGVIHGIRTFVPIMLRQDTEAHVVNTSSLAGLIGLPNAGIYCASKFAVVAISEALHHELALRKSKIKVSVVCPASVNTHIYDSERNRPTALRDPPKRTQTPEAEAAEAASREMVAKGVAEGIPPEKAAERVFEAIRDETFYVLTHRRRALGPVKARMEAILEGREPDFNLFSE